jgi:UDP-3-O-[3-hydroxymyristoyl] N-acetylglucosamine deacetylase
VLDGLGDLALLGHPIIGKLQLHKAGHALHHMLIDKALKSGALALFQPKPEAEAHHWGETELRLPDWAAPSEVFAA